MSGRYWTLIYWLAAALFAAIGILRLAAGDLRSLADLTMAVGLVLLALRPRVPQVNASSILYYLPEFFIMLAVLQYGYYWLGV